MKKKHKEMYMRIAEAVAQTSSAKRLKVGAVAVKNNMVIGTGYNAQPSGVDSDCEYRQDAPSICLEGSFPEEDEKGKYRWVTSNTVRHAEANLLLNLAKSTESSDGAVLFCTHSCCKFCAMDIVDAGIKAVYYKEQYRDTEGIDYLKKNGIIVQQI